MKLAKIKFSSTRMYPGTRVHHYKSWMQRFSKSELTRTEILLFHQVPGYPVMWFGWDNEILDTTIFSIGTELHRNLPLSRIASALSKILVTTILFHLLAPLHFISSLPSFPPVPRSLSASLPHFLPSLQIIAAKISSSPCSSIPCTSCRIHTLAAGFITPSSALAGCIDQKQLRGCGGCERGCERAEE